MSNELDKNHSQNILAAINDLVSSIELQDVKTTFNSKTGTASITGNRDGIQYTTTLKKQSNGVVQTTSYLDINLSRVALKSQIKELRKQGFKQQQIADMLNISQATVSNYLKTK